MAYDLIPPSFWRIPSYPTLDVFDEDTQSVIPGGLSISEDDSHVFVEAALPGLDAKDIEITFDRGVIWIKGETKEEDKKRKYYRKSTSSFSYRVAVPGNLDQAAEPKATYANGVMTVAFAKSPVSQPKKIAISG